MNSETVTTSRKYLYLTVFIAGMSTLAIEFTTSRMLQTVYGTSNIVWANVIGLVLLFLMGVAPVLPWRKASTELLRDRLFWPAWMVYEVFRALGA